MAIRKGQDCGGLERMSRWEEPVLHEDYLSFKELPSEARNEMEHNQAERGGAKGILFVLSSVLIKMRRTYTCSRAERAG